MRAVVLIFALLGQVEYIVLGMRVGCTGLEGDEGGGADLCATRAGGMHNVKGFLGGGGIGWRGASGTRRAKRLDGKV
jgi:hypothetical protein